MILGTCRRCTFSTVDFLLHGVHGGLLVPLQGFRINGRTATCTVCHPCVIDIISSTVAITQKVKTEESKEKMCFLTARTRFTVYQYAVFLFIFSRSYLLSRLYCSIVLFSEEKRMMVSLELSPRWT